MKVFTPVKHHLRVLMIVWLFIIIVLTVSSFPAIVLFAWYLDIGNPLKFLFILPFSVFCFIIFFLLVTAFICGAAVIINKRNPRKDVSKEKLAMKKTFRLYFNELFMIYSMLLQPGRLKNFIAKCFGMRLGKNVKICKEVRIYNPDYVEIGDNTLVGSYCLITPHLEEDGVFTLKKIKVGSNCLVGGGTWILPGTIVEDNVRIGARSLIPKNKVLQDNTTWVGSPVKRVK